jgi:hypothetical protein
MPGNVAHFKELLIPNFEYPQDSDTEDKVIGTDVLQSISHNVFLNASFTSTSL